MNILLSILVYLSQLQAAGNFLKSSSQDEISSPEQDSPMCATYDCEYDNSNTFFY